MDLCHAGNKRSPVILRMFDILPGSPTLEAGKVKSIVVIDQWGALWSVPGAKRKSVGSQDKTATVQKVVYLSWLSSWEHEQW